MDKYYVVEITAIRYPRFGVLINIVSKEDITYRVTIGDMLHCTCFNFNKMSCQSLGNKEKWMYCKHLQYVFRFLCKVNYDSDKFIHAPTYSYNEVIRLLELAGVVDRLGVHCTKHVRVYVSAQKGYLFEHCRITYTYNKHI